MQTDFQEIKDPRDPRKAPEFIAAYAVNPRSPHLKWSVRANHRAGVTRLDYVQRQAPRPSVEFDSLKKEGTLMDPGTPGADKDVLKIIAHIPDHMDGTDISVVGYNCYLRNKLCRKRKKQSTHLR